MRQKLVDTRLKKLMTASYEKQAAALDAADRVLSGSGSEVLMVSQVEATRMLGVSRYTLRRWAQSGLLRPVAIPGRPRYRLQDLRDFASKGGDCNG